MHRKRKGKEKRTQLNGTDLRRKVLMDKGLLPCMPPGGPMAHLGRRRNPQGASHRRRSADFSALTRNVQKANHLRLKSVPFRTQLVFSLTVWGRGEKIPGQRKGTGTFFSPWERKR